MKRGAGGLTLSEGGAFDITAVMEVMDTAFPPCFGEAWTAQQCLGILGLPGVWLTVARLDGRPAGFALGRAIVDEAELLLIAVDPAFRRRGIGQALLDNAMTNARAHGAERLHLEVRQGNEALALYHKAGFEQVGRRPHYYRGSDGNLSDALSLVISLR